VVDDGSSDGSGPICDAYAAAHPGWRVIHQPNAGLGAARNVGLAAATGVYVGFVDGDDLLFPAYADLLGRAQREDADVATGAVQRTDGSRTWRSGLHSQALDPVGESASLREDLSLIYDTTAWNKIYRRSFLQQHGLAFPEGVLYEDLPLTVRALYFAGDVCCVHDPVYAWRTREQGGSITQRRNELGNLNDRFAAVQDVDRFLHEQGSEQLREAHDLKVLRLDLPLYTSALPEADETYRAAYLAFFRHLVADLPTARRQALPPTLRLYIELAEAGRMDDLVAAVRARRGARAWAADDERGRLQRIRDDLATYRLERELGLVTRRQVVRRAAATTTKILLPTRLRDAVLAHRRGRARPTPALDSTRPPPHRTTNGRTTP
jgi:CDP-glycerol glycerophosphotransferase